MTIYKSLPALAGCFLLLLAALITGLQPLTMASSPQSKVSRQIPVLEQKKFPSGTVYILTIPKDSRFKVVPLMTETLAGIESKAWQANKPIFIINGGYFDPNNRLTTSFVYLQGVLAGDPRLNTRLVDNPKLQPYLPSIFNRTEFRVYHCQGNGVSRTRYDITLHDAAPPAGCILRDAVGAGPALLPKMTEREEAFVDYNEQDKITRDPIGVCAKNARSALGLTSQGDVIIAMGAQDPANPKNSGFNLEDMATLLKARGAVKAIGLDGGSSSGILYQGKPYYGKFNANGTPVKRPVKSVLAVITD